MTGPALHACHCINAVARITTAKSAGMTTGGTIHSLIFDINFLLKKKPGICGRALGNQSDHFCYAGLSGAGLSPWFCCFGAGLFSTAGEVWGASLATFLLSDIVFLFGKYLKIALGRPLMWGHQLKITMPLPKNLWLKLSNRDTQPFHVAWRADRCERRCRRR